MAVKAIPFQSGAIKIPPEQYDMPVSCDSAGNFITLREALEPGYGTVQSLSLLSPEKRAELTVKRIEAQSDFELAMIGGGMVDRARAIKEVKAHTDVGRIFTEIELRVVNNLLETLVPHPGA